METRRRGAVSLPEELRTNERLSTKKELAQRKSLPPCPFVPMKPRKSSINPNEKPKALFFTKSVQLSLLYDPELKDLSYVEQCFYGFTPVGEGSFGRVYRSRYHEDDELYAIKRQKPSISMKDIYAEVENNEKIESHPNCAKFFMAWEESGEVFLLLEYCDMSLADYASANNSIPEPLLWDILYDICQALAYLHEKKLIHLDVKPGNIMMKKGFYKLCDFGTLVDLTMPSVVRKSTLSDGDAKYLALEVLDGIYQTSCDIFGLGISILELATDLELPTHGPLWHRLRRELLPISRADITLGLKVVIERMLRSNYTERPTAAKMLKYACLKTVARRDRKNPRIDYADPYRDPDTGIVEVPLQLMANRNNNNNNLDNVLDTPRCSNNISCLTANANCPSVCGRVRNREQGPSRTLGRKSLFKLLADEPETSENAGGENSESALAFDLDATMESPERENRNPEANENMMITSTPNLKLGRRMPKTKLVFE